MASVDREADLFFADLMGGTSGALLRRDIDAEAFFAELVGESIESLVEDFSEQGRRRHVTPSLATATPIATNRAGVDRRNVPTRRVGGSEVADPAWMGMLIDNSNLRFTGAYVTGPAPPGLPDGNFTVSSKQVSRGWMANIQTFAEQGWGAVFFYVGFSIGGGHPAPAGLNRARGVEHGLHLRTTLHNALGAQWAGATVFIDNEDGDTTTLTADLIEYYVGLFDEMSRPDRNLAAFRPAFYGHGRPVGQVLARRRDLFVWDVELDTDTTTTPDAPFALTADPLNVDPASRPIRAYQATPAAGGQAFVSWPLGRQFRFYTGDMPADRSTINRRLPAWSRQTPWDYDASFVRNPAFPAAEPRIAARQYVGTSMVVADIFQARGQGATPTPPLSRVVTQQPGRSSPINPAAGITVEPDAPLTLFFRGGEMLLVTVLSGGGIGTAVYDGLAATWGPIERIGGGGPALRRSRALQGVTNTASNVHVFYIGADHRLYVKRQTRTRGGTWTPWTDGQAVIDDLRLHPFSALAGIARRGDWVETFFIDEQGRLASAWWARNFTAPFPGFQVQRLQTNVSLLPGGALAAVAPHPDHILVFGVGSDQRLHFAVFVAGRGWTAVSPVGGAQDFIGVHTRLAAHAINATEVEVAALTDSGSLTIYPFRATGSTWTAAPRRAIADPPPAEANPPAGSAAGFRINPFGDLAILRTVGLNPATTVFCAALRGTQARTLRWNGDSTNPWQSLPG